MNEDIRELVKERNNEVTKVQLVETIKTTRVITKVETILATVLLFLNIAALIYWYYSQTSIGNFLKYYLTIGLVINVASIVLHNLWENKYILKKANIVLGKTNLIRAEYSGKIKQVSEGLYHLEPEEKEEEETKEE